MYVKYTSFIRRKLFSFVVACDESILPYHDHFVIFFRLQVSDFVRNHRSSCDKKASSSFDYDTVRQYRSKSDAQIVTTIASLAAGAGNRAATNEENAYPSKSTATTSPKQKSKFPRFWNTGNMGSSSKNSRNDSPAEITVSACFANYTGSNANSSSLSPGLTNVSLDLDEKQRRRAFAHYDCQSIIAKLGYNSKLKSLLAKRRNTTTGASAASMLGTRSLTPDGDSGEEDFGDGRNNDLIER